MQEGWMVCGQETLLRCILCPIVNYTVVSYVLTIHICVCMCVCVCVYVCTYLVTTHQICFTYFPIHNNIGITCIPYLLTYLWTE